MFSKKAILLASIGIAIGAIGGFIYWKYVGCISGTCAIWSDPAKSTLYGAVMGGLVCLCSILPGKTKIITARFHH